MNHWYLMMADYEYTAQTAQERAAQRSSRRQSERQARRGGWRMAVLSMLGL